MNMYTYYAFCIFMLQLKCFNTHANTTLHFCAQQIIQCTPRSLALPAMCLGNVRFAVPKNPCAKHAQTAAQQQQQHAHATPIEQHAAALSYIK